MRSLFRKEKYSLLQYVLTIIVLIVFLSTLTISSLFAQINFGSYRAYSIELSEISFGDLVFESPIVSGGGEYDITLDKAFVFSIEGVNYLDVGVLITADGYLYLDGDMNYSEDPNRRIQFNLKAAYANSGQNNIVDAKYINVLSSNFGEARFPILSRQIGPPGPPPPPPTNAFEQSLVQEEAYLYLYGTIDVGEIVAGDYYGKIYITIEYDNPPDSHLEDPG